MTSRMHLLLLLSLLFSVTLLTAQEQLGLRMENYAGISSVPMNPTWQSTNSLAWDLNLAAAYQFVDNNYAYFENVRLRDIIQNAENIRLADEETPAQEGDVTLNFYNTGRKKYVSVFAGAMGPSLSVRLRDAHYLGFFTRVRFATSTQDVPSSLNYYDLKALEYQTPFSVPSFQIAAMTWSELGLSYAHKIETYAGHLTIGGNIKFLTGYESVYMHNTTNFELTRERGDSTTISTPNIAFGYTNSNEDVVTGSDGDFRLSSNGGGVGFDLGATLVFEGNEDNYKFKIGASLIDLGSIKFRRNTGDYLLSFPDIESLDYGNYKDFDSVDSLVTQLSNDIYGDPNVLQRGTDYRIGLPSAFSFQADYMVVPMFYLNGMLVQRFSTARVTTKRGNLLAMTPRFEHRWFAASLPLVLYNYQHFDVGASVRLAFLTIGTDNLGSLISNNTQYTGMDFYIALKVNPFDIGLQLGDGGGRGGRGNVKCYKF